MKTRKMEQPTIKHPSLTNNYEQGNQLYFLEQKLILGTCLKGGLL